MQVKIMAGFGVGRFRFAPNISRKTRAKEHLSLMLRNMYDLHNRLDVPFLDPGISRGFFARELPGHNFRRASSAQQIVRRQSCLFGVER
jgi:hypothetical protein